MSFALRGAPQHKAPTHLPTNKNGSYFFFAQIQSTRGSKRKQQRKTASQNARSTATPRDACSRLRRIKLLLRKHHGKRKNHHKRSWPGGLLNRKEGRRQMRACPRPANHKGHTTSLANPTHPPPPHRACLHPILGRYRSPIPSKKTTTGVTRPAN